MCVIVIIDAVEFKTCKLSNYVLELGSVDAPLFHIGPAYRFHRRVFGVAG